MAAVRGYFSIVFFLHFFVSLSSNHIVDGGQLFWMHCCPLRSTRRKQYLLVKNTGIFFFFEWKLMLARDPSIVLLTVQTFIELKCTVDMTALIRTQGSNCEKYSFAGGSEWRRLFYIVLGRWPFDACSLYHYACSGCNPIRHLHYSTVISIVNAFHAFDMNRKKCLYVHSMWNSFESNWKNGKIVHAGVISLHVLRTAMQTQCVRTFHLQFILVRKVYIFSFVDCQFTTC